MLASTRSVRGAPIAFMWSSRAFVVLCLVARFGAKEPLALRTEEEERYRRDQFFSNQQIVKIPLISHYSFNLIENSTDTAHRKNRRDFCAFFDFIVFDRWRRCSVDLM